AARRGTPPPCRAGHAAACRRAPRPAPPAAPAPAHARCRAARRSAAAPVRRARLPSRVQSRLGPDRRITPADLLEAWTVARQRVDAARVEQLAALPLQPFQGL